MLNIYDKFSDNYDILFNVDKYQLLHCTNDKETVDGLYYKDVYCYGRFSLVITHFRGWDLIPI